MLVSVLVLTYNHETFLGQALDSILSQRVAFDLEVWVGEDCSADRTAEVLASHVARYSGIIKPIYREKNVGLHRNFVDTMSRCQGKYIALLSGDDYWIDTYKLQKQVDFLEEHPEYVLVCGNALILFQDTPSARVTLARDSLESFDFGTRDLLLTNPCIASTAMFRNGLVKEFPPIYFRATGEDRQLWLLLSLHGKCRFINEVLGVYRKHGRSITGSRNSFEQKMAALEEQVRNAEMWNEWLGGRYTAEVDQVRRRVNNQKLFLALQHRRWGTALKYGRDLDLSGATTKGRIARYLLRTSARVLYRLGWR